MRKVLVFMFLFLFSTSTIAVANTQNDVQPLIIAALDETPVYSMPKEDPKNLITTVKYGTWFPPNYQVSNGWITVTLQDGTKIYLSNKHVAAFYPHQGNFQGHQVNVKIAYMFSAPSSNSNVRAIIPNGSIVFSFGTNGDFYYISYSYNNQTNFGFISKNVLKTLPPTQPVKPIPPPVNYNEFLLYSNDGRTYLGKLNSNSYDTESVCNQYGTYGSKYSSFSIWNQYGCVWQNKSTRFGNRKVQTISENEKSLAS
ncbi:hypothetical protein [Brevibacillus centrosporus]|uniref:hypothetical protein n=1 Tax=Brevibacillus centrosporus TaxID=54910 RepID=UPI0039888BA2